MKILKVFLALVLASLIFVSPLSFAKQVSTGAQNSIVYVYRVKQFFGAFVGNDVIVDGVKRGVIRNGGYLSVRLKPGRHMIAVDSWGTKIKHPLLIKPGVLYFLRLDHVYIDKTAYIYPAPGVVLSRKVDDLQLTRVPPRLARQQLGF